MKSNYNGDLQKAICYFTEKFGGLQKINRHIPSEVFSWNYESKLAFLAGMIDADGYVNDHTTDGAIIQIGSTNKELALQQAKLLEEATGCPVRIEKFRSIIFSHTGPGTIGVGYIKKYNVNSD